MIRRTSRTALAAALLGIAVPAAADDVSEGVAPGRFRTAPAGAARLEKVLVELDGDRARVELTVATRGRTAIRLKLPAFRWMGEAETYQDRQMPELRVDVDGRRARPDEGFSATVDGRNVTAAVRAAGVDPFAIAETPPLVAPLPGRKTAFDELVATGAVRKDPVGMLARWSAARTVGATTAGAGRHVLAFSYDARPAIELASNVTGDIVWSDYCMDASRGRRLMAALGPGLVVVGRYAFPAALDGARASRTALQIVPKAGTTTVVCTTGGAPMVDPSGRVAAEPAADGTIRLLRLSPTPTP